MLLESEAAHSTAIEELRKKVDEIVKELNALKEVYALQLGRIKHLQYTQFTSYSGRFKKKK